MTATTHTAPLLTLTTLETILHSYLSTDIDTLARYFHTGTTYTRNITDLITWAGYDIATSRNSRETLEDLFRAYLSTPVEAY